MKLNDYQAEAGSFANYTNPDYPFLGLAEEAGEVLGKLAKYTRVEHTEAGHAIRVAGMPDALRTTTKALRADLIKELGDVLWMVQQCATEINIDLDEVAKANINKLTDRKTRGVIVGSGDNR